MYWYVSIYSEECFWTQYMYSKLIPFNEYRWFPLGKLSHLGLEQLQGAGGRVDDTYTIFFIEKNKIPRDWIKEVIYGRIVVDCQPHNRIHTERNLQWEEI